MMGLNITIVQLVAILLCKILIFLGGRGRAISLGMVELPFPELEIIV